MEPNDIIKIDLSNYNGFLISTKCNKKSIKNNVSISNTALKKHIKKNLVNSTLLIEFLDNIFLCIENKEFITDLSHAMEASGLSRPQIINYLKKLISLEVIDKLSCMDITGKGKKRNYYQFKLPDSVDELDEECIEEITERSENNFLMPLKDVNKLVCNTDSTEIKADLLSMIGIISAIPNRSGVDTVQEQEVIFKKDKFTLVIRPAVGLTSLTLFDIRVLVAIISTILNQEDFDINKQNNLFNVPLYDIATIMNMNLRGANRQNLLASANRLKTTTLEIHGLPESITDLFPDITSDFIFSFLSSIRPFYTISRGVKIPQVIQVSFDPNILKRLVQTDELLTLHQNFISKENATALSIKFYSFCRMYVHSFDSNKPTIWEEKNIHVRTDPTITYKSFKDSLQSFYFKHLDKKTGYAIYDGYCFKMEKKKEITYSFWITPTDKLAKTLIYSINNDD